MLAKRQIGEDADMDFATEGLLDGLQGQERQAREQLLASLYDQGFTLGELRAAVAEDRLVLLPVERLLGGCYTAGEVEEKTGVSARLMLRIRRLNGLPDAAADARVFGEEDLDLARSLQLFLDSGLSDESISEMNRVLGEAMARVAATTTAAAARTFLHAGDSEQEVAERFATMAEKLTPALEPVFLATFKAHLRETIRRGMIGSAQRQSGDLDGEQILAVAFADVVGFTHLGSQVEVQELGQVASALAELAADVADGPVRLVKTIGDAAMFVSVEPGALVAVVLSLMQRFADAELPALRAGIAVGAAVQRAGDFYGHAVNLASRVTGEARPGSVLCTQEVHDAAPDDFDWSFAGRHRMKGIERSQPLHRARPLADE